ncbi:MAG: TrkA domain protein [Miltoncostaeaceae bacterium]|jgi:TrkA domain protein|nr:TrkA domain protein [Miltoncostaeaceae bacterium]
MSDVTETKLPGVGVRHDFTTHHGDRIGMIAHRAGHRDLLLYDRDDPDSCGQVVRLEEDDVRTLADLLGAGHVTERLTELQSVPGLSIDWVPVDGGSACSGRRIGEIGLREDLGASIVALVRDGETIPSPPPDLTLRQGDTAVAVGTPEGIRAMHALLQGD